MNDDEYSNVLKSAATAALSAAELINAATVLEAEGKKTLAQRLYRTWIGSNSQNPLLPVALFNGAVLDSHLGEIEEAIASLETAIRLKPDFMPPYINLGSLYEKAGQADRAVTLWQTVVNQPTRISGDAVKYAKAALIQIARVFSDRLMVDDAEEIVQTCLTIDSQQPELIAQLIGMRLSNCKWPIYSPLDGLDRNTLLLHTHPLSMTWYTDDPLLHLACAERFVRLTVDTKPRVTDSDRRAVPIDLTNRRLRIGYISSDLRDHAIGYLMAEMFELHNRQNVEVFAYYCGTPSESNLTKRIQTAVEHWTSISKCNDDEAANIIAADGLDILVDVNGHTRDSRTGVFARRPAPIQVNWLGYPGSMGSPYHHYIIADDWIIPSNSELYYSEKVVRLPCYQPNDRKRKVAAMRPTRKDAGLPENAVVFCCFNGSQKYSRHCFERWIEILKAVPDSVLWLIDTTEQTKKRLADFVERAGVSRERLIFAYKCQNEHHLARYPLADLFLDSSPYGAHTTASDALWMGIPVLTLSGRGFAARVCGSLVRSSGLPELVCTDAREYVSRAIELGKNPAAILAYKAKLEANRNTCQLFDTNKLVSSLESLYRTMCEEYQRGELPSPDLSNLDAYYRAGLEHDPDVEEVLTIPNYHTRYTEQLWRQHLARPLAADTRFWTASEIAAGATSAKAKLDVPKPPQPNDTEQLIERFNSGLAGGNIVEAEKCAAALTKIAPGNVQLQNAAFHCNLSLGRRDETVRYAKALIALEPAHVAALNVLAENCHELGDVGGEIEHRVAAALADKPGYSPLLALRDIHDASSLILCHRLNLRGLNLVQHLLAAASKVAISAPSGSDWEGWEKHYRLLLDAVDLPSMLAATPAPSIDRDTRFASSTGVALDWAGVKAAAENAKAVFFTAADEAYVDLYARWYILSVLKYTDVPSLVIVHVIGGASQLKEIAETLGVDDPRLIFAGDDFDATTVETKCYDSPPKGLIAKPVAHLQSARFIKVGALLQKLNLPVFVSDIDLLLQRGVSDLLEQHAHSDLVLNENTVSFNAGSRLTANLLLLNPTENTALFLQYLRNYLERMLGRPEVSRWIDQLGLTAARHHLIIREPNARLSYFDTNADINNVMYRSYQKHPFRFLSLYHGFDTSSLEKDAGVLGQSDCTGTLGTTPGRKAAA